MLGGMIISLGMFISAFLGAILGALLAVAILIRRRTIPKRALIPDGSSIFSLCLLFFSLDVLFPLAVFNLIRVNSLSAFYSWFLTGAGVYWFMIVGTAVVGCVYGTKMQNDGSEKPSAELSGAENDKRWILKFGGRLLSVGGLGLMLIALWLSQRYAIKSTTFSSTGTTIGFYDLMTWLGTFATFVVVVATALVAMYVKRRDDEARHSSAVMTMRQAWINAVRKTLSELIAQGQALRAETELIVQGAKNPQATCTSKALAANIRKMLREVQLQLNPTEGHHAVLIAALREWLHEAGIEDHFRAKIPKPVHKQTDFDAVTDWLVILSQLVLKIEWVVTSIDGVSVSQKVGRLWNDLEVYEKKYSGELEKIAPQALKKRKEVAKTLLEGANQNPAHEG